MPITPVISSYLYPDFFTYKKIDGFECLNLGTFFLLSVLAIRPNLSKYISKIRQNLGNTLLSNPSVICLWWNNYKII